MVGNSEPPHSPTSTPPSSEALPQSMPAVDGRPARPPEAAFDAFGDMESAYSNRRLQRLDAALLSRIAQRSGIVVLIGEAGDGKTVLLDRLIRALSGDRYNVLRACGPGLTCDGLISTLSQSVGVPPPTDLAEWRAQLHAALLRPQAPQIVVIIDEAERMNGSELDRAVVRLRRELGEVGPFKLILAGRPELTAALRRPCLRSLHKATRIYRLRGLKREEVGAYIANRCDVAGYGRGRFTAGAVEAVGQYAGGSPGRINRLCGRALAVVEGLPIAQVDAEVVRHAAAELGYGGARREERPAPRLWWGALAASLALGVAAAFALLRPDSSAAPAAHLATATPRLAEAAATPQKSPLPASGAEQRRTASAPPAAEEGAMAAIIRRLVPAQPAASAVEPVGPTVDRPPVEQAAVLPRIAEIVAPAPAVPRGRSEPNSALARVAWSPAAAPAASDVNKATPHAVALLEPAAGPSRREPNAPSTVAPAISAGPVEPERLQPASTRVPTPLSAGPKAIETLAPTAPAVATTPSAEAKPAEPAQVIRSPLLAAPLLAAPLPVEAKAAETRVAALSQSSAAAQQTIEGARAATVVAPIEPKPAEKRDLPAPELRRPPAVAPGPPAPLASSTAEPRENRSLAAVPPPTAAPTAAPVATTVAFAAPPYREALPIRVFLHHTAGEREKAARLADDLRRRGLTVADIRAVPQTPRSAIVRFYYDADRDHVRTLANVLAAVSPGSGVPLHWSISDFTRYHAPPRAGNVEVWIPD